MKTVIEYFDSQVSNIIVKIQILIPYATLILVSLVLIIAATEGHKIFIVIGAALLLIIALSSVERLYFFLGFYMITFEESGLLVYFPGIPISYNTFIAGLAFFMLILYWWLDSIRKRISFQFHLIDKALLAFFILILFSLIMGFLKANKLGNIVEDFVPLTFFATYFIVTNSSLEQKFQKIFDFFLFCTFLISLQFIYAISQFKGTIFLTRIVSQHIHMALFGIPYIGAMLLYSESRRRIACSLFLLPFLIAAVIISQQRALWFSAFLLVIILVVMFFFKFRKQIMVHLNYVLMITIGICIVGVASMLIINHFARSNVLLTMLTRSSVFLSPKFLTYDESAIIRVNELKETLGEIKNDWVFGVGLGEVRVTRWRDTRQLTVDNSYIYLIWKMGIIGLFSFLFIYFIFYKHILRLLAKPLKPEERTIVVAILLNFIGIFIVALTNASIAHYRFIYVWATMIAAVEFLHRKYE